MKRVLVSFLAVMCVLLSAKAYDFMVDGLAYRIEPGTYNVAVTYEQDPVQTGWDSEANLPIYTPSYTDLPSALTIPPTVTYNGTTYAVTAIGQKAFHACSSLTSVTIPASVTGIELNPFEHCNALEQITVADDNPNYATPDNCNGIVTKQALTVDVYYVVEGGGYGIPQYYGANELVLACKSTVIPSIVKTIGYYAYHEMNAVTDVVIPEGVTKIDQYAFGSCRHLSTITLPSSITEIGNCAFNTCSKLRNVYAYFDPSNVTMGYAVWQMVLQPQPWNPAVNLHVYPQHVSWYEAQADDSPWVSEMNRFNVLGDLGQSLVLKGSYDGWQEGVAFEMKTNGVWVATQLMDANAEFKLIDQDGNWWGGVDEYGSGFFLITEGMIADSTAISLVDGANFRIPVAGIWRFTADMSNKKLYVTGSGFEHVYIMGLESFAANEGVEMDTEDGVTYTKEVTIDDSNGSAMFYFTTRLGADAGDYSSIYQYCLGSIPADIMDFQVEVTDAMMGQYLPLQQGNKYFTVANGDYTLSLNLEAKTLVITSKSAGKLGDANSDGNVDVSDVTTMINYILQKNPDPFSFENADVNGDGAVTVQDVTLIIEMILQNK